MRTTGKVVADLNAIGPAAPVLSDDFSGILFTCQQESANGRRNSVRNLRDLVFVNHTGTAWHVRDESEGCGTERHREFSLVNALDATDFYSWFVNGLHASVYSP